MARTPTGTITSVATAFSASKTVTGISNAAEALVSAVAHGFSNGDVVILTSGWGRLNGSAWRIKSVLTDSFVLEGCDTTNTDFFTPGAGGGSAVKATTWVQASNTLNHNASGGDPKPVTVKFEESDVEITLNDGFTATSRTFEIDADQIGTPFYAAMKTLTQTQGQTVIKRLAKTGAFSLIPGKVALNEEEVVSNGIMVCKGAITGTNRSTRYAS